MTRTYETDIEKIRELLEKSLRDISWTADIAPNWDAFRAPAIDGVLMAPSARPLSTISMGEFIERMTSQRDDGSLKSLEESPLSHHIRVFGNIAIAMMSFEARVNGGDPFRGANAFLLAKDGEEWHILGITWDNETSDRPLPEELRSGGEHQNGR